MKQFLISLKILIVLVALAGAPRTQAMEPRLKALLTMAGYGTAGGALLGAASMAFGTSSRSIFKGASIGLYAGIVFGSYVVITHAVKTHKANNPDEGYYPDTGISPYEGGYEPDPGYYPPERWDPYFEQRNISIDIFEESRKNPWDNRDQGQVYYLDLVRFQF